MAGGEFFNRVQLPPGCRKIAIRGQLDQSEREVGFGKVRAQAQGVGRGGPGPRGVFRRAVSRPSLALKNPRPRRVGPSQRIG